MRQFLWSLWALIAVPVFTANLWSCKGMLGFAWDGHPTPSDITDLSYDWGEFAWDRVTFPKRNFSSDPHPIRVYENDRGHQNPRDDMGISEPGSWYAAGFGKIVVGKLSGPGPEPQMSSCVYVPGWPLMVPLAIPPILVWRRRRASRPGHGFDVLGTGDGTGAGAAKGSEGVLKSGRGDAVVPDPPRK